MNTALIRSMIRCHLVAGMVLAAITAVSAGESAQPAVEGSEVELVIGEFIREKPYLAVSVGISEPGSSRLLHFGQIDRSGKKTPPTGETLYEIGSITKTMTCSILAMMADEGIVELSAPANRYLPEDMQLPDAGGTPITLEHLATHTSSLPVQPPAIGVFALTRMTIDNPYSQFSHQALVATLKSLKVKSPPGVKAAYSNLGMGMLGHALVGADHAMDFETLLQTRLLTPLALNSTRITLDQSERSLLLATPHNAFGSPTSTWDFATLEACGAVRSSPSDLVRWMEINMGVIETPQLSVLRQTHTARWPRDRAATSDEYAIGLGWHLIPLPGRSERAVFHNGGTGGSRSFLAFEPQHKVGVVILSNSAHSVDKLGVTLLTQLLERHAPPREGNLHARPAEKSD